MGTRSLSVTLRLWPTVFNVTARWVGFPKMSPHSSDTLECQSWCGPQEDFALLRKVTASLSTAEPREAKEPAQSCTGRRWQNQNQDPWQTLA